MKKRLDRSICNDAWINFWSSISCCTLTKSKSDHYPLLLDLKRDVIMHQSSFKFMKKWALHPECIDIGKDAWKEQAYGCPMFVLTKKLKSLKSRLKEWNKNIFGDVHLRVSNAMQQVYSIQQHLDENG